MPAFARSGGQWIETVPRARQAAGWTDEDDQLFARIGGAHELIYPDPAAVGALLPPEALEVTDGPTHFSVEIGWTNPTQPTVTPTDVQVRIAELGAVWTEFPYPTTSATWGALAPATSYVAQVRYVRRVEGLITHTSATGTVEFTTDAAPIGPPAEDPGSPGGTSTTFPLGGSTGNPTAPSTPDGCWWEWKLQILDQDTTTINWQDTGITGTEDGDAEDITYDATSLDNTRTYRLCIREACDTDGDGTADDFGDWSCSAPFAGAFDWGVTCGSVPLSPVVELEAAADAVWAFPRYCAVGDGLDTTGIVDAISNTQIGKGADFAAIYTTTDGEWGVVADADGGITLTAGLAAISTNVGAGLDFTIVARRRLSPGHSFSNGRTTTLASIGGGAIVIQAVETATGWYPTASFRLTSGYVTLSGSGDAITTKGNVHAIALRWDADGDKKLALDGVDVDTDSSGDDLHASVAVQPMYWTAEVGLGSTMQQIGWDRVLTDEELTSGLISTTTFDYAGAVQGYTVPVGATRLKITCTGGCGSLAGVGVGGLGHTISAWFDVTAGTELDVYVGGVGTYEIQTGLGGWPNGGDGGTSGFPAEPGGCGGGGSSDVRPSGGAMVDAWIVGGAGGGAREPAAAPTASIAGNGGYPAGTAGANDIGTYTTGRPADGGLPGTASAPGTGGAGSYNNGGDGDVGGQGNGGKGGNQAGAGQDPGGGGGGGWHGGGGGGHGNYGTPRRGASGGGGSSYVNGDGYDIEDVGVGQRGSEVDGQVVIEAYL